MNLCGTNRFTPRKNQKIEKNLCNLFLGNFTTFSPKRGTKQFTSAETSFMRLVQFIAANQFMPRFFWYFKLIIIHGWKLELSVKT